MFLTFEFFYLQLMHQLRVHNANSQGQLYFRVSDHGTYQTSQENLLSYL